jgi:ATP-dependent RNA helicase RhlE
MSNPEEPAGAMTETNETFDNLPLHPTLQRGVKAMGYTTPTPIQSGAIPDAVLGRDIIGSSQTGSGKTAAFLLPILERLIKLPNGWIYALVLTPTRELALQAEGFLRKLGAHTRCRGAAIYGGVGMGPQVRALRGGAEVIVATPGRLLDHMRRGNVDFRSLQILVLDEADRMLDMGFMPDIMEIMHHLPKKRQTMLFTATMPQEVIQISREFMVNPHIIRMKEETVAATGVSHRALAVPAHQKTDLLCLLLNDKSMTGVLVFARTKHRADRLAHQLSERGIRTGVIHGDRSQGQRERALEGFRSGRERVLVATDVVARGIDVEDVSHVVNFDLPIEPGIYVHRVGRTARAGRLGDAITLVSPEEKSLFRDIERHLGTPIQMEEVPGFVPTSPPPQSSNARRNEGRGPRRGQGRSHNGQSDRGERFSPRRRPPNRWR